jgi:type IV secretion system protein VirB3
MIEPEHEDQHVITPVHRALTRPDLVFGCERGPLVFLFATAFTFFMILQKPVTIALGVVMLFTGIPVLRYFARRDPQMYRVYTRHFAYQSEYPPHPTLARPPLTSREQQR